MGFQEKWDHPRCKLTLNVSKSPLLITVKLNSQHWESKASNFIQTKSTSLNNVDLFLGEERTMWLPYLDVCQENHIGWNGLVSDLSVL